MSNSRRQSNDTLTTSLAAKYDSSLGIGLKAGWNHSSGTAFAATAGDHQATRFVVPVTVTVSRISTFLSTGAAGRKLVMGIYSGSGGLPGTKITQSSEYTTVDVCGRLITLDLQSPVTLVKDTEYWFTFMSDTTQNLEIAYTDATSGGQKFRTQGYSATLPTSFGAPTGNSGGHLAQGVY